MDCTAFARFIGSEGSVDIVDAVDEIDERSVSTVESSKVSWCHSQDAQLHIGRRARRLYPILS